MDDFRCTHFRFSSFRILRWNSGHAAPQEPTCLFLPRRSKSYTLSYFRITYTILIERQAAFEREEDGSVSVGSTRGMRPCVAERDHGIEGRLRAPYPLLTLRLILGTTTECPSTLIRYPIWERRRALLM
ncbi:hypothetical protein RHSP_37981 [Rhizobium freirei PRF 81]|uniref:Uncharacterized protein n=1 Tax=Rhizobium freirei PRF 81 TaxID=363754 RepID=N6VCP2_9HYPH|nr:hypothetical protein RHSP_37981 [Rhizobium freirei PRF 81]